MEQIKTYHEHSLDLPGRIKAIRQRAASAVKWWAEHQAWPATDEIRIDRHRSTCG